MSYDVIQTDTKIIREAGKTQNKKFENILGGPCTVKYTVLG